MNAPVKVLPAAAASASEVLRQLRDGSPRTRAELASVTGLARSTVAARIDDLVALRLVAPYGDASSTGGRPPSQFALDRTGRLLVCADLGASHATVAICDLTGAVLAEHTEALNIALGPERVLTRMLEIVTTLLEGDGRSTADLVAVGIGLPGPVEFSTGRPSNPPIMPGWDGFDVPGWVQAHVEIPVLVDNDVNIMALGERTLHYPGIDDLVFIKVATGIGAGIISSGTLQRGSQGIAGDIGHVRVARGAGIACPCGNTGCLEAIASGPAIAKALRERGLDVIDHPGVLDLVRQGDTEAIQAIRQAGRDLGEVLTACISFINPAVVVIGGSMAQAGEHLLAGVREVVYSRSAPLATQNLQIVPSRAGAEAAVVGAAALAMQRVLSPGGIEMMATP
jgi:predicted NBD/HSP70 family sugar kinase